MHARGRIAIAALLVFPLAAACGDDDDDATPTPTSAEAGGDTGTTGGAGGEELGSSLTFTAIDIAFEEEDAQAAAGSLDVTLTNEGAIEHSWLVDGHEDELRLYVQQGGATDQGTITLDAGEYTYYCDIPGHREAGMEGTLTVE